MKRYLQLVVTLGSLVVSCAAHAVLIDPPSGEGLITGIYTYTDYGTGDVVVTVQVAPAACQHGYWIRMTDVGAKQTYALILSAYHARTALRIGGYDDQLWAGSSGKYCRIYYAGPVF